MNLIDAIKSGRPFRRSGVLGVWRKPEDLEASYRSTWSMTISPDTKFAQTETFPRLSEIPVLRLSLDDVLAEDWEIQEPAVTITASQFYAALSSALSDMGALPISPTAHGYSYSDFNFVIARLRYHLGLEVAK